jgi:DNA-binding NarL/FixJ family response regulator
MIRLLVIDDHAVVREGVKRILAAADDILVAGEAEHAEEAYTALAGASFDLVLLDISLPNLNGLEMLRHLRTTHPDIPVLIFSMHGERQYLVRALQEGARGYLLKSSMPRELIAAIHRVNQGERYISTALVDHLVHEVAEVPLPLHARLAPREMQVLCLLAAGYPMKEIAYMLHVSIKTVSTYRRRILGKLHLRTTVDLVRYALQYHLVQ